LMSRLVISFVIAMGISSAALGAEKPQALPDQISPEQRPLAQTLTEQQMTQGLTTETPSGAPGLVYQGGVAGYSGPTRESDNRIGTSLQAETDRQSATQKAVEDLRKAVVEQKNGAEVQKALRQSQTAIQAQFDETTRALQQQQQTNPSPNTRRGGGTGSSQTGPQQGNSYGGQNNSGDLITAVARRGLSQISSPATVSHRKADKPTP